MFQRMALAAAMTIGLFAICATPAMAQQSLNLTITAGCSPCQYSVTATGNAIPNFSVTVGYSFTVTSHGIDYPVSFQFDTTTDANGDFSESISGFPLPGDCNDGIEFSNGWATLNTSESGFLANLPSVLLCSTPPPPGKTLEIGPSSMEGHLLIRPGDWISGGYSFVFTKTHAATTVTVTSTLTVPFRCSGGATGEFVINLGTHDYAVPAGDKTWQPTGDANNVLSWAGAGVAPAGCGPGSTMDNSQGAIWKATISENPETGSLVNWRFKYRDPNAKGKGNVNCLDLSDPRRNKADVCGASWSETVKDP
jgi:hypothetical protein